MQSVFFSICVLLLRCCASSRPDLNAQRIGPLNSNVIARDNPWRSNCNQSLHDYPGCIVGDRNSLPRVREDLEWEILYIRVLFPNNMQMLPKARAYHGAVLVMEIGGTGEVFLMGYFCYEMGLNVAVPIPTPTGFNWANNAAVSWFPSWVRSPFDYFDSVWPLGRVSGAIVNQWLDDVPNWAKQNSGYRLVSMWSEPQVGKATQYVPDATCHTFCMYSFKKLFSLGAKFTSQWPLCRNYAPFIVEKPAIVDIHSADKHAQALSWYADLTTCFAGWYFTGKTCAPSFVKQKFAFAIDDETNYYEGNLTQPYFAGFQSDQYLEQRMILPWQDYVKDAHVGECVFPESQTSLTRDMNKMMSRGLNGVYTGGFGVLVRSPFDGLSSDFKVTPATLWVNDLFTPSSIYPGSGGNSNPSCPNNGDDGWLKPTPCSSGPWDYAQLGVLAGYSMEKFFQQFASIQNADWNYGVFYPYDSNSVDKRCRWLEKYQAYDCPGGWLPLKGKFSADSSKLGAGGYPAGNPETDASTGGGAGCHFEPSRQAIDQTDGYDQFGRNLVMDYHCQCNTAFNKDWGQWVENWILHAKNKPGLDYQGWFAKGKAPNWGGDIAACWMSNPRDMINLQNALWFRRFDWNNQKAPASNWQGSNDPASNRPYWGWNEVPVDRSMMNDPGNWDSIIIKLPAALGGKTGSNDDSVVSLSAAAQGQLEADLTKYISAGYLMLGGDKYSSKPGSAVVFVREIMDVNGNYNKEFFCQPWTSPNQKYDIVFISDRGPAPEGTGACYVQNHGSSVQYV